MQDCTDGNCQKLHCFSLFIFCLDNLSIGVTRVLKSHTIIVLLPISPFIVSVCLMYLDVPILSA